MFFFGSRYHKLLEMRPIREGLFASEDQWLVQRYFVTEIVPFLGAFYVSVQGCIYIESPFLLVVFCSWALFLYLMLLLLLLLLFRIHVFDFLSVSNNCEFVQFVQFG